MFLKFILNFLLRITWASKVGSRIKYRFKKLNFNYDVLGWSIVVYKSEDCFEITLWKKITSLFKSEVIKTNSISGVADPFLIHYKKNDYIFFEAINKGKGEIWCGEFNTNVITNIKCVLSLSEHISYPNVFEYEGEMYMLPESSQSNAVRLYKAIFFPVQWIEVCILRDNVQFVDTNWIQKEGVFYWFTYDLSIKQSRLFFSDSLLGCWTEHRCSPFIGNRNAGDFIYKDELIVRPVQYSKESYGQGIDLKQVITLTPTDFLERDFKVPFLRNNCGFSLDGIHHISVLTNKDDEEIIAVDGKNNNFYEIV